MGRKRKMNWQLPLGLVLVLGAVLLFLWPTDREKGQDVPTDEAPVSAAPAEPIQTPGPLPDPGPTPEPRDEDAARIRIAELMVKNRATLPDEDGDFPDWIELYNGSASAVDLTGWLLRDSESKPFWTFPETRLEAGERMLLFASGKNRPGHIGFSLSAGETLQLYTDLGAPVQELLCPDGEADRSWLPDGSGGWTECLYPTPGLPNTAASYVLLMEPRETNSPLVINEACTYNQAGRWKALVGISDWIELKNVSDAPVELSDYYVSDDVDQRLLYRLPEKTLGPGEFFLLMCNKEFSLLGAAPLCQEFSLNSTADRVYLSRADGSLADYVSLRGIPFEASYGRMPEENGWFYLPEPSPGRDNADGQRRVSAMPAAGEPDGVFNDVESVTVTLRGPGEIRFTTDGSYPTADSPLYEEPITLSQTGIVRAICVEEGALPSRALTLSYIINEHHSLPVVSLVGDSVRLAQIYDRGTKDSEAPASLSFYEDGGSFTIPCGVKMHGETSLSLPKKNMSLRFRGIYGQEELHYDVFGYGDVCDFNNLLLRSGQDYFHALVRNELCTELALQATDRVLISRNRYCILYMNGKYMGIYALGEKLNEAMYAHYAGVSRESVTVETPPNDAYRSMYQEVISYALANDLSQPEHYALICSRLDVDSLIDWLLLEGCFANDDLTFGNVRYCRSLENDGKWRLMFYDLDSTFYNVDTCFANLLSPWARATRQVSQLINALLKNPDFRARLLTRAGELIPTALSNDRIIAELDLLAAQVEPETARDYIRFNMAVSGWEWNVDWIRSYIRENDWNRCCINNLCYYLNVTPEERALYFPGS